VLATRRCASSRSAARRTTCSNGAIVGLTRI
jgi:hypothetical protein